MDRILVLLATFNGEKYIQEQIESIARQDAVEVKIVINDDGSTDDTLGLTRRKFPEITVNVNQPGTGSAARNFMKMLSEIVYDDSFNYVCFSDQDDVWLNSKLSAAITMLKQNGAELYCSNLTKWDFEKGSYTELKKDYPQKKFDYLFEGGSAGCTYVFTKSFAIALSEFSRSIDSENWTEFSHDWMVYFFARASGRKVFIDSESYIHYRIHGSNVHGHLNKLSWQTIKTKISRVLKGYHIEHANQYIKYVDQKSEAFHIYSLFLGNYWSRNGMIWRYNTQLMRDWKKLILFSLLNLFKFNR